MYHVQFCFPCLVSRILFSCIPQVCPLCPITFRNKAIFWVLSLGPTVPATQRNLTIIVFILFGCYRTNVDSTFIHSPTSSKSSKWRKEFFSLAMGPSASRMRHTWNLSQYPRFPEHGAPPTRGNTFLWKWSDRTDDVVLAQVSGWSARNTNKGNQIKLRKHYTHTHREREYKYCLYFTKATFLSRIPACVCIS